MLAFFWIASIVAIVSTVMVITRRNAIHALLYLIVSLLSAAVIFMLLGAPFVAMLEVIVYAGAIMVLFVFVVMLLNLGPEAAEQERQLLNRRAWIGPCALAFVLVVELFFVLSASGDGPTKTIPVEPKVVAIALFDTYLIGVELAGFLLLGGLIGAYHIGRRDPRKEERAA
jgi:NADH-quinone oxidoreductase subunit J